MFEWLRQQRMERAKHLLVHSSLSVQQVALEVGYEDQANFSTAYKRCYSVPPHRYRKLMMESKESMTESKKSLR